MRRVPHPPLRWPPCADISLTSDTANKIFSTSTFRALPPRSFETPPLSFEGDAAFSGNACDEGGGGAYNSGEMT